jgi:hypothetical protein
MHIPDQSSIGRAGGEANEKVAVGKAGRRRRAGGEKK